MLASHVSHCASWATPGWSIRRPALVHPFGPIQQILKSRISRGALFVVQWWKIKDFIRCKFKTIHTLSTNYAHVVLYCQKGTIMSGHSLMLFAFTAAVKHRRSRPAAFGKANLLQLETCQLVGKLACGKTFSNWLWARKPRHNGTA